MVEIGKDLQAARIEKGYTLDDLQQITKIQKRYLIAIEDERFEALPGDFYVKAFIKQYAETVDIDATEFLSAFESRKTSSDVANASEKVARTRSEVTRENIEKSNKVNHILGYLPTIIVVAVVLVILGSIYYVAWSNHQKDAQTQQIESSSKISVSSQKTTSTKSKDSSSSKESTSKDSSSSSSKASAKKNSKQKIKLSSNTGSKFVYTMTNSKNSTGSRTVKLAIDGGNAWSAVSANGTQQWQGTLSSGQEHEVNLPSGTTVITINLGNSGATTLTIDGKKFNFKKDNSELTVRTLTINVEN